MKTLARNTCIALLMFVLAAGTAGAQQVYQLENSSEITIQGTSTLHDWESVVEESNARLVASNKNGVLTLSELSLNIETASIKSGKDVMDRKTMDALKAEKHPQIKFVLNKPVQVAADGTAKASGMLFLAGAEKQLVAEGKVNTDNNNNITIEASYTLNMKDYGIDPPAAMFGTIKTGEEVTVVFTLHYHLPAAGR